MSTDWDKYSTIEECRNRARYPDDNAVIRMNAGEVREIPGQRIEHHPVPDNPAHTDVLGDKNTDPEVRTRFLMISAVVLPLG
jgi:hypothetical protein